jgi:gentisate 1,2-dioxygenase
MGAGVGSSPASTSPASSSPEFRQFLDSLAPLWLYPLWRQEGLLLRHPVSPAVPYLWRYAPVRERLLEAGRLISAEEAERRVLILKNPGLGGKPAATQRLYAGLQLVLPGELAPAHRHAAAAIRFVIEAKSHDAYTAVDGERVRMAPGDLILNPAWAMHDHGNDGGDPIFWLDGLDLPLINDLDCAFFEPGEPGERGPQALSRPDDASERAWARGALRPAWGRWEKRHSPVLKYPWTITERLLYDAWKDGAPGTPEDGLRFEYSDPTTGGPVLPTMACYAQLLRPGEHTRAHRHTGSAVYHVVRGAGTTAVDGTTLTWQEKDTFCVPGWAVHEHHNDAAEPALLFSFTDDPALRALGFWRELSA